MNYVSKENNSFHKATTLLAENVLPASDNEISGVSSAVLVVHFQNLFLNFEKDLVVSTFLGGLRAPPCVCLIVSQQYLYNLILDPHKHF